ncbi:hypothetical protein ACF0H5_017979 [Mactra antiquata]
MSQDIQLKGIKKTGEDDPPAYANIENQGKTNLAYEGSSQESLNDKNVNTLPGESNIHSVDINTDIILEENGLRHRNNRGQDKSIDFDDEVEQYEESSDEDDDEYNNKFARGIAASRAAIFDGYSEHKKVFWTAFWILIALLYLGYFCYAMAKYFDTDDEGAVRLLVVTILVFVFIIGSLLSSFFLGERKIGSLFGDLDSPKAEKAFTILHWILVAATSLFIIIFIIVDVALREPRNLISGLGMIVFILLFFVFSKHPAKVKFRPVFWGLALQFYFALLILRTKFGYDAFEWLGERVREFLEHTDAGSSFVFGNPQYLMHFFAFKVLTVIIFFSAVISVLYYLGVMQFVICYIARFLAWCLDTSPTESLNAAANIFIGQSESPLMIRPFVKDMTKSELHAVCTGGFATIAGSVLAAYIAMDVPANHLLSASVMSAPAALAMSKLFWPETKQSKARAEEVYNMKKGTESNIIEAASNGAAVSIGLIANIAVNLIAFLAFLHFFDSTLIWFGHRVGLHGNDEVSFTFICSYVFYPISWLLGTPPSDVRKVAGLIGTKTFLNEFVAYADLAVFINNTNVYHDYMRNETGFNNGTTWNGNDIILNYYNEPLVGGIMTDRGIVIATYALCGFSNIGSIGIMLGALGIMAPNRKKDITKVIVRAMIAGNVACFMTACISGLLYQGP